MPTASKLVAFICYALIAVLCGVIWWSTSIYASNAAYLYRFLPLIGILGGLVGWFGVGPQPHLGGFRSIALGLKGSIILVFVVAVFFAIWRIGAIMFSGGVLEPLQMFRLIIRFLFDHMMAFGVPNALFVLILGGALAGRLTGLSNKYWR